MARSVTFAPKSACSDPTAPRDTARCTKSRPHSKRSASPCPCPTRDPEGLGVTVSRAIAENEWVSNAGHRVWQLLGRIICCSECGRTMGTNAVVARKRFYYRCAGCYNGGLEACSASRYVQAEKAEAEV